MTAFSVADAKDTLPRLIDRALAGEEVVITRHGKPVVEIRPVGAAKTSDGRGTHTWLQARTAARPKPRADITSVKLLDLIYDGDRD